MKIRIFRGNDSQLNISQGKYIYSNQMTFKMML